MRFGRNSSRSHAFWSPARRLHARVAPPRGPIRSSSMRRSAGRPQPNRTRTRGTGHRRRHPQNPNWHSANTVLACTDVIGTPAPTPRWRRLDHDERRQQILACASRLFSERTYAAVSTTDIAKEAGRRPRAAASLLRDQARALPRGRPLADADADESRSRCRPPDAGSTSCSARASSGGCRCSSTTAARGWRRSGRAGSGATPRSRRSSTRRASAPSTG